MILRCNLPVVVFLILIPNHGYSLWNEYFTANRELGQDEDMCLPSDSSNSKIYCGSKLIEAVNYVGIYNDSKTFVDSPMKRNPDIILDAFDKEFGKLNLSQIDADKLKKFLDENFSEPTSELIACQPKDWVERPANIMRIQDETLRNWALELNGIWKDLCRKIDPSIKDEMDKHSIIWVDHPFIIPGGRFREFYYWDTFWIVKGLLISGMHETAKGMARNLANMVARFGFVPNGGRIYYRRSQPPMLSPIVYIIYEETDDLDFVKELLPLLDKEFQFWEKHRKFNIELPNGNVHAVYFYRTGTYAPRPESLKEDLMASKNMDSEQQKQFFESIASAAESGQDFGSRWFEDGQNLNTTETVNIAPIDLNSYMCYNMNILHYLYEVTGDQDNSTKYEHMYSEFKHINDAVFYNDSVGAWFDFNIRTGRHIVHVNPAIAAPLFTDCYDRLDDTKPKRVFELFLKTGFFNFSGGVPTSLKNTSQQWDFPNGWAPSQHQLIEGLRKSASPEMQDKAFEIASKWISGNFKVYNKTKHMYEKYNVIGKVPEPGEYNVQTGFGWSNGVILDLLNTYYDRIQAPPPPDNSHAKDVESGLVLPALALFNIVLTLI